MNEIYIHIGLHKTGSTFLQNSIFPSMKGVQLVRSAQLRMDEAISKLATGKTCLISSEGILGIPWKGQNVFSRNSKLDQLYSMFPRAKIIVYLRRQGSYFESLYKQYLHEGGTKNPEDLLIDIDPSCMQYANLLQDISTRFGSFYVGYHSNLVENPHIEIQRLLDFMNIAECKYHITTNNRGVDGVAARLLRFANRNLHITRQSKGVLQEPGNVLKIMSAFNVSPRHIFQGLSNMGLNFGSSIVAKELKNEIDDIYSGDWESIKRQY